MRRVVCPGYGLSILLLLLLGGWSALPAYAQEKAAAPSYSVAILPGAPASEIKRRWQPLLDQLSRDTGLQFRLRFYENFPEFESALGRDEPDFAVLTPIQTWRFRNSYRPQVHGTLNLTGLVLVQKRSDIQQLGDLQERSLALQEGENLSANSFVLQSLKEQKISVRLLPVSSENNALRSLLLGKADAAVVNNYALKFTPAGMTEKLRIIHQTTELPAPAFAASLRLPADDLRKVKAAMLHLQDSHPKLLQEVLLPGIHEADLERDYGIVGKLFSAEAGNGSH